MCIVQVSGCSVWSRFQAVHCDLGFRLLYRNKLINISEILHNILNIQTIFNIAIIKLHLNSKVPNTKQAHVVRD